MKHASLKRRRLGYQALEKRNLLAAYISELLVAPLFGNRDTDQYIELRGEPNATLDQGTYFAVAGEARFRPGTVHSVIDLSGQSFGANGFLTLLQHNSPHEVNEHSNVLQSTTKGYGGLPGDIYSDNHSISDRLDFIIGSNAYFLVQSDTPIEPGFDIDADDNGRIDESVAAGWEVLDSISLHPFVGGTSTAYGSVVYAEIGARQSEIDVPDGVDVVHTEGFGYAARVGVSTGSDADDWFQSTARFTSDVSGFNQPQNWQAVADLFGTPSQYEFSGRDLEHLGEPNFVATVSGTVTSGETGNPLQGINVFADHNGNGRRDVIQRVVDPDMVVREEHVNSSTPTYPLLNAFDNVTITDWALSAFPSSGVTAERERDFPNTLSNRIFSGNGIDWFSSSGQLRFDFYTPVRTVSITAIGSDNSLSTSYPRLSAFNAEGELIATQLGGVLRDSQREVLTVHAGADEIAYVLAFSDTSVPGGGPFGRFDRMVYNQLEPMATTDSDGNYELTRLFPGTVNVTAAAPNTSLGHQEVRIEKFESINVDFQLGLNQPPRVTGGTFSVAENAQPGSVVGVLSGEDPDGTTVWYQLGENADDRFTIDSDSGEIRLTSDAELNYETESSIELPVRIYDGPGAFFDTTLTVIVNDVNEPPTIAGETTAFMETAPIGTVVAELTWADEDPLTLVDSVTVTGGTLHNFVQIDRDRRIRLIGDVPRQMVGSQTIVVTATDTGTPPASAVLELSVDVLLDPDFTPPNDAPITEPKTFSVPEAAQSLHVVGAIRATDPDEGQSLSYQVTGGTGQDLFSVSESSGLILLKQDVELDFESTTQYTLEVRVSDDAENQKSATATHSINVTDSDDPLVFLGGVLEVNETIASETVFGTIGAIDPDGGEATGVLYQIVGGSGRELFDLNLVTGEVSLMESKSLDFETRQAYTLEIMATAGGQLPAGSIAEFQVLVGNGNDAPEILTYDIAIPENAFGPIGRIHAIDQDPGAAFDFRLLGGTAADLVTVAPDGTVTLNDNAGFNASAGIDYAIEVEVFDPDSPEIASTKSIPIDVAAVAAPVFSGNIEPPTARTGMPFEFRLPDHLVSDNSDEALELRAESPFIELPTWLNFDPINRVFRGVPTSETIGNFQVRLNAFHWRTPHRNALLDFRIDVQATELPLHNQSIPADTDGDGEVRPLDALLGVNFLDRVGTAAYRANESSRVNGFFDVNGDGTVSPLDLLLIINHIFHANNSTGQGEEAIVPPLADDTEVRDEALVALYGKANLF